MLHWKDCLQAVVLSERISCVCFSLRCLAAHRDDATWNATADREVCASLLSLVNVVGRYAARPLLTRMGESNSPLIAGTILASLARIALSAVCSKFGGAAALRAAALRADAPSALEAAAPAALSPVGYWGRTIE